MEELYRAGEQTCRTTETLTLYALCQGHRHGCPRSFTLRTARPAGQAIRRTVTVWVPPPHFDRDLRI